MRKTFERSLVLLLAATLLTACSNERAPRSFTDHSAEKPVYGGTLRVVGGSDVDHLMTTSGYVTTTLLLIRTMARQLVAYRSSTDFTESTTLVADVALELPSLENGGISADGRVYTFHLRPDVRWNTSPPRAVVAGDFERAFKLFCNPVNPVGAPTYYGSCAHELGTTPQAGISDRDRGLSALWRQASRHRLYRGAAADPPDPEPRSAV
ncbi:hypothetical protein ACFL33_03515 [Pseudomonadota bacterium]